MARVTQIRQHYGIWLALALCVLALWGAAVVFLEQQFRDDLGHAQEDNLSEFMIIESVVTNELQDKNYQSIEPLLGKWGKSTPDTVELSLVAGNGFVIGHYRRKKPAQHYHDLQSGIDYSYDKKAVLSIKRDLAAVHERKNHLAVQLFVMAAAISAVLSYLVLLGVRRRTEAEVLRIRTIELDRSNEQLKDEIIHRTRVEQNLHREKQLIEMTLHSIGDAVITTDNDGNVTYLNPVAERLTQWTLEEARGRPMSDVMALIDDATRQPTTSRCTRPCADSTTRHAPGRSRCCGAMAPLWPSRTAPRRSETGRAS